MSFCFRISSVVLTIVLFSLSHIFASPTRGDDFLRPPEWRRANDCGPVSMMCFSHTSKQPISYSKIRDLIEENRELNMLELSKYLKSFGINHRLAFNRPKELLKHLPAIIHYRTSNGEGHFVVALSADEDSVLVIDGIDKRHELLSAFESKATGYAIVSARHVWSKPYFVLSFIATNVVCCVSIIVVRRVRNLILIYAVFFFVISTCETWIASNCNIERIALRAFNKENKYSDQPMRITVFRSSKIPVNANSVIQPFRRSPKTSMLSVSETCHWLKIAKGDDYLDLLCQQTLTNMLETRDLYFSEDIGLTAIFDSEDSSRFAHRDYALALSGELSLPLSTTVTASNGESKDLKSMLRATVYYFDLHGETEFSIIGLVYYVAPVQPYIVNRYGDRITFDDMVLNLLNRSERVGSCFGTHAPYALELIWQAHKLYGILSDAVLAVLEIFFVNLSRDIESTQATDGRLIRPRLDSAFRHTFQSNSLRDIYITGHHLEWQALVPSSLRCNEHTIRQAIAWSLANWAELEEVPEHYTALTQLGRAILLLQDSTAERL
jgi:hypothetical protein